MPLWKLRKGNITRVESGLAGGAVMPYDSLYIADPTRRERPTCALPVNTILLWQHRVGRLPPPPPGNTPANERQSQLSQSKVTMLHTPSLYQWTFLFVTAPPNFLLSSTREQFISFAPGNWHTLHVLEYNSLLFLNTPIFCW